MTAWPPSRQGWTLVAVATTAYVCSFADRALLGLVAQPVKTEFGLTDTEVGLLLGPAFAIFYATTGLPMGWLVDRVNRTRLLGWAAALWSTATAATAFATGFGTLFLARMAVGIGEAALSPGALSLIADSFPPAKRGAPIAVYSTALTLGSGLAALLGAAVLSFAASGGSVSMGDWGEIAPWRLTFLAVGLPGLILAPLFWSRVEPARRAEARDQGGRGVSDAIAWIGKRPGAYLGIIAIASAMTIVAYSHGWMAAFFQRRHGWSPQAYATANGLLTLVVGTAAVNGAGWINDRLNRAGAKDATILVMIAGLAIMVPATALAPLMPDPRLCLALLALGSAGMGAVSAVGGGAILSLTPARVRGQVVALYYMAVSMAGLFLGPPLVGLLSDRVTGDWGLGGALAAVPILFGTAPLVLAPVIRRLYRDALEAVDTGRDDPQLQ